MYKACPYGQAYYYILYVFILHYYTLFCTGAECYECFEYYILKVVTLAP